MRKPALAEIEPGRTEPPDATQLCAQICRIIESEYSGDICSELWARPARRAAERIMNIIYSRPG